MTKTYIRTCKHCGITEELRRRISGKNYYFIDSNGKYWSGYNCDTCKRPRKDRKQCSCGSGKVLTNGRVACGTCNGGNPKKPIYNRVPPKPCVVCGTMASCRKFCSKKCKNKDLKSRPYVKAHRKLDKVLRKRTLTKRTLGFKAELLKIYANRPEGYHVDHIIPLNHPNVSGLNVPWNLQYLKEEDNERKSNQFDGTYDNISWKV